RIVSTRFQVLFHSPPGVLFTFPSRYLSAIGHKVVFRLTRWSWQIHTGFHGPGATREHHPAMGQFLLGGCPPPARPPHAHLPSPHATSPPSRTRSQSGPPRGPRRFTPAPTAPALLGNIITPCESFVYGGHTLSAVALTTTSTTLTRPR